MRENRKKIIAVMLLCITLFALTACQSNEVTVLTPNGDAVVQKDGSAEYVETAEEEEEQEETKTASQNNSDLIYVGFAQVGSESGWRLAQTQSMKDTFTEENGYQFDFVDCNNDQNTQLDALAQFIEDGVDYIVLDPIVEEGYDDVLQDAKEAGIPVIVVDRNISAAEDLYTCWVGSDFAKEGTDAANWLAEYLDTNNRSSEDINIVTILGTEGASSTIGRTEGFHEAAKAHSNWNLLDQQSGDYTEDGGNMVMKAFLKQYPDIDVVVCQNDDEAFGAISAVQDAGLTCGPNGDIIIISFDATGNGFQRMVDGEINVDVECNPLEGPVVSDLIQKLEAGEEVETIQYMEEGVYAAEDAADIIDSRAY